MSAFPRPPHEPVTIDIGDGKQRELRYDFVAMQNLKRKFGKSLLRGEILRDLDEEALPDLIFEGLADKSDIASSQELARLLMSWMAPYLMEQFKAAFQGDLSDPNPNA